jgi:hypothetical protein
VGEIVRALDEIARRICPVVWHMHPRIGNRLAEHGMVAPAVAMSDPVSHLDMLFLPA